MERHHYAGRPEPDPVLGQMLGHWKAPVAPDRLEADVLRAIRCQASGAPGAVGWPVAATAKLAAGLTFAILIAAGFVTGYRAGLTITHDRMAAHPVYRQSTLTGAYLVAATSRRAP